MRNGILATLALLLATGAAPLPSGIIAEAQRGLRDAGFDPGPVNGVMTDKTARAIRAYGKAGAGAKLPAVVAAANAVAQAQQALAALGLLQAPADGTVGPATRDAIIRFQAAHRMPVDPRVSDALLAALAPNAAAPPAATPAPPPPPSSGPAGEPGRQKLPAGVTPPPIR